MCVCVFNRFLLMQPEVVEKLFKFLARASAKLNGLVHTAMLCLILIACSVVLFLGGKGILASLAFQEALCFRLHFVVPKSLHCILYLVWLRPVLYTYFLFWALLNVVFGESFLFFLGFLSKSWCSTLLLS